MCLMLQPAPNHHSWNGPSVGHLSGAGPQPPAGWLPHHLEASGPTGFAAMGLDFEDRI